MSNLQVPTDYDPYSSTTYFPQEAVNPGKLHERYETLYIADKEYLTPLNLPPVGAVKDETRKLDVVTNNESLVYIVIFWISIIFALIGLLTFLLYVEPKIIGWILSNHTCDLQILRSERCL